MNSRTYKIEGLNEAGSTYKICICPPKQCKEDQMCNLVTTKVPEIITTTTKNSLELEKQTKTQYRIKEKLELQETAVREDTNLDYVGNYNYLDNSYQPAFGVSTHDQGQNEKNPSVYLAVGAVLSILIIFIVGTVMFVFLKRKKGKLTSKNKNIPTRSSVSVRFNRNYSVGSNRAEVMPLSNDVQLQNSVRRNNGSAFYKPLQPAKGSAQRRDPVYQTIDSANFRRNGYDTAQQIDNSRIGSRTNVNGSNSVAHSSQLNWTRNSLTLTHNSHVDIPAHSDEILEYAALPKPNTNEIHIESPSCDDQVFQNGHSYNYAGCNRPVLPQGYNQENNFLYSEQPYNDSRVYTLYSNQRDYEQIIEC